VSVPNKTAFKKHGSRRLAHEMRVLRICLKLDRDCKMSVVVEAWFDLMFLAHRCRPDDLRLAGDTTLAEANNP
jgi:hypothetical protein